MNQVEGRDTSEYDDAIKAYLTFAKRPTSELAANKHYAHIEPFQDPEIPQTSFHIILDMEKYMLEGSNLQNLPLRFTASVAMIRAFCKRRPFSFWRKVVAREM